MQMDLVKAIHLGLLKITINSKLIYLLKSSSMRT